MTLMYPLELRNGKNDYIEFTHFEYKPNLELSTSRPAASGNKIILYMPNSTPGVQQAHDIQNTTFGGPLGAFVKKSLQATGGLGGGNNSNTRSAIEDLGRQLGDMDNLGSAGLQAGLDFLTRQIGYDAATAVALGQGKAFNPNAEMIYKQPQHRSFTFAFDFLPKSDAETVMVDNIIYEFKRWSAPFVEDGGNFMEIPHLWQAKYCTSSGGKFSRMNAFHPAFIRNFAVQDNPSSAYHMTIDDGSSPAPVHTAINIFLEEVKPPNRNAHESSRGMGYVRGH